MSLKTLKKWRSALRPYYISRIIPCTKLLADHSDRGALKKLFKDCFKKLFGACYIDRHRWSTLADNCGAWCLVTNHVVSSFKNIRRASLKDKMCWRRNHNITPSNLTRSLAGDTACLTSVLSVTNVPAVGVDWPFPNLCFKKPSHDL